MEFSLANLQPKERASFALRALYEAAGCRKYHMGRFEEYGLYQANRSFLSSEQVITFTDLDGRLLALKPDVTPVSYTHLLCGQRPDRGRVCLYSGGRPHLRRH